MSMKRVASVCACIAMLLCSTTVLAQTVSPYAGSYTVLAGDASAGAMLISVDTKGGIYGELPLPMPTGLVLVKGKVKPSGAFVITGLPGHLKGSGTITTAGAVTGRWTADGASGTFLGNRANVYAGSYTGFFGGGASGAVLLTVTSNGSVSGSFSNSGAHVVLTGVATLTGAFTASGDSLSITGQVQPNGSITGTWTDSAASISGTFSALLDPSFQLKSIKKGLLDANKGSFKATVAMAPLHTFFQLFDPTVQAATFACGDLANPLVIQIPPGSAGWSIKKGAYSWKSARGAVPKVSFSVSQQTAIVKVSIAGATIPKPIANPVLFSMQAGGFCMSTKDTWPRSRLASSSSTELVADPPPAHRSRFSTLPDGLRGSLSRNLIVRGILNAARRSLANAFSSRSVSVCPGRKTTAACTTSPSAASGLPKTAASCTEG